MVCVKNASLVVVVVVVVVSIAALFPQASQRLSGPSRSHGLEGQVRVLVVCTGTTGTSMDSTGTIVDLHESWPDCRWGEVEVRLLLLVLVQQ